METPASGQERPISSDFPFRSRFVEVAGSRLHYVDEGEGDPILFLHGNPTSSYLWRNVIPHVTPHGRAVALDLIGMGKSDKPDIGYRFADHARYVDGFIDALRLKRITFVIHDWGSALGFHHARRHEENVAGLAFMEAILAPIPSWADFPEEARDLFRAFRSPAVGEELIMDRNVFIERVLPGSILRTLSEEEMARYREPFPNPASRRPVWRWPNEIPIEGEPPDVTEAVEGYNAWLRETPVPKLLVHTTPGVLIRAPLVEWARSHLPELRVAHVGEGLHFIQEDRPHEIGAALADWLPTMRGNDA